MGADMPGAVQPGKWGDFDGLHKNPLYYILKTRTIEAVYIAGNRFHREIL